MRVKRGKGRGSTGTSDTGLRPSPWQRMVRWHLSGGSGLNSNLSSLGGGAGARTARGSDMARGTRPGDWLPCTHHHTHHASHHTTRHIHSTSHPIASHRIACRYVPAPARRPRAAGVGRAAAADWRLQRVTGTGHASHPQALMRDGGGGGARRLGLATARADASRSCHRTSLNMSHASSSISQCISATHR